MSNNQIPEPKNRPILKQGADGEWVSCIQNALNGCGYGTLSTDGDFGNLTAKALTKFQKDLGLTANGIAEEKTWTAIDKHKKLPLWLQKWPSSLNLTGVAGADTMEVVTSIMIQKATTLIGKKPLFWGRYFAGSDAEYIGGAENKILHNAGIRVAPVGRKTNLIKGDKDLGKQVGGLHADDVLKTFGEDYLVSQGGTFYIFLDTEPEVPLSAEYYLGWSKAIAESSKKVRFLPAVYMNRSDDKTAAGLNAAIAKGAECHGLWVANYAKNGCLIFPWSNSQAQTTTKIDCPVLIQQYKGDVDNTGKFNENDGIYDFNQINPYLDFPDSLVLNRLILPPI